LISVFKSTGQVYEEERDNGDRMNGFLFDEEGIRSARGIGKTHNLYERTVCLQARCQSQYKKDGLRPKKPGPKCLPQAPITLVGTTYHLTQREISCMRSLSD